MSAADDKELAGLFGEFVFKVTVLLLTSLLWGHGFSVLWGWFVVPLWGLAPIGVFTGTGLRLVGLLGWSNLPGKNDERSFTETTVLAVLLYGFALGWGWLVKELAF